MKSSPELIASITEEIVSGCLRDRRVDLAYVLDQSLYQNSPLLDCDDLAKLVTGDAEERLDVAEKAASRARRHVEHWLASTTNGMAFVERRMEQEETES